VPFGKNSEQLTKLKEAKEISINSAIMSCSWGAFQVMGEYYDWLYNTPEELEKAMNMCEVQQMAYFKKYLENVGGMITALKNKKWSTVALKYNGKKYKDFSYDTKMQEKYNILKGVK